MLSLILVIHFFFLTIQSKFCFRRDQFQTAAGRIIRNFYQVSNNKYFAQVSQQVQIMLFRIPI